MIQRHHARAGAAIFTWGARRSRGGGSRRRPRPCLERLESRSLLSGISEFAVPSGSHSSPDGITTGPNGDLWFTEYGADKIGTINSATHTFAQFPISTPNAQPFRITLGPDGNLWFTEFGADQIGTINATTHVITEYPILTPNAQPYGITAGPNNTIWFTEWDANQIGMINIGTGKVREFPIPTADSVPEGITIGPGGSIWFTESLGNQIGTINTTTGKITELPLPTPNAEPDGITLGPGGNLWFTEYSANQIGMYNPTSGVFSNFSIPTSKTEPTEVLAGPDGNVWFTQSATNQIGMLNPTTRAISESTPLTVGSAPRGIAAGPDGNVWFAELNSGRIGVVAPDTHLVVTAAPTAALSAGTAFGLTVTVEYDSGAVDTGYNGGVSVALANGPGGAALGGPVNVTAVNGVATFSGLSLNEGGGYTLQVSGAGAPAFLAGPFNVMSAVNPPPNAPLSVGSVPMITGEHSLFAGKGRNKHLVGFQLVFSSRLDPSSAANYTITQTMKHGRERVARAIRLRVEYDASSDSVNLMLAGRPRFTSGGQLVVKLPQPSGTGGSSVSDEVFSILPGGRGIEPLA